MKFGFPEVTGSYSPRFIAKRRSWSRRPRTDNSFSQHVWLAGLLSDCDAPGQLFASARHLMRIAFIGCVEFSYAALEHLLTIPEAEVVAVITRDRSDFNTDFRSLRSLAEANRIPCFLYSDGLTLPCEWLSGRELDVGYVSVGPLPHGAMLSVRAEWSVFIPPSSRKGTTSLMWAHRTRLTETASTFFS